MEGSIFLIEDDDGLRELLSGYLTFNGWRVHSFDSAEGFRSVSLPLTPSVVLLDVQLPGISGLELQKRRSEFCRSVPFIFISGALSVSDSVSAMKGGALEFLVKPVDPQELHCAVERALFLDTEFLAHDRRAAALEVQLESLSPREREVHALLMRGANNTQIMTKLGVSIHTAKQYKSEVLRKLEVTNLCELIEACALTVG
jgi:FixJ family two-component response regulator